MNHDKPRHCFLTQESPGRRIGHDLHLHSVLPLPSPARKVSHGSSPWELPSEEIRNVLQHFSLLPHVSVTFQTQQVLQTVGRKGWDVAATAVCILGRSSPGELLEAGAETRSLVGTLSIHVVPLHRTSEKQGRVSCRSEWAVGVWEKALGLT